MASVPMNVAGTTRWTNGGAGAVADKLPALTQEQLGAMFESHQSFDTDGIKRNSDMKIRPDLNRREFLQTTALAASALPFMGASAETFLALERSSVSDQ